MARWKWDRMSMLSYHRKDYNDMTLMQCSTAEELASLQTNVAAQIARTTASCAIDAFVEAFVKDGLRNPEQNAIDGILNTKYMKEIRLGKHYHSDWVGPKFYKHPAIIALTQI
eukprot:2370155-Rhodomonas_salina.1